MIIVADASPLIALYDGECLSVLQLAFTHIIIPQKVYDEVFKNRFNRVKPSWIKVQSLTGAIVLSRKERLLNEFFLDEGESEAVALAEILGTRVLLDDRNARTICKELNVDQVTAYEICAELFQKGTINKKKWTEVQAALRLHNGFSPGYGDGIPLA